MRRDKFEFHVECKKKDRYLWPRDRWGDWQLLQDNLLALLPVIKTDYEVVVFVVGNLDSAAHDEITSKAERVLRAGGEGVFVRVPDCILQFRKVPKPELRPGLAFGLSIPAWQNPAACVAHVRPTDEGLTSGPALRVALYVIDAHKLSQVLSSYRKARVQLPERAPGLIYIDVDTSAVPHCDHSLYFKTLRAGLLHEFRRNRTERVSAVVVIGGTVGVEITPNYGFHRSLRSVELVRNPYLEWPASYPIPGLELSQKVGAVPVAEPRVAPKRGGR